MEQAEALAAEIRELFRPLRTWLRAGAKYSFPLNENGSLRRELFQEIANKTAEKIELVACHRQRL
ncbi:MAG: hypothetical protein WBQ20_09060, partial [Methyloceanibacter sp.]